MNFEDLLLALFDTLSACQDDTPLGRLMQDLNCKDPAKMHYKELADTVNYFKSIKEGEANMTSIIEMYAQNHAEKVAAKTAAKVAAKAAEEAVHQSNVEFAKNLLAEGMSEDFIVRTTKLSLEEVRALAAKQSA